jgi:hypothetical protein
LKKKKFLSRVFLLSAASIALAGCNKPKFYASQKAETLSDSILGGPSQGDGATGGIPTTGGTTDGTTGGIPTNGGTTDGTTGSVPTTGGTGGTAGGIPSTGGTTSGTTGSLPTYSPNANGTRIDIGTYRYVVPDVTHPSGMKSPTAHNLYGGTALPTSNLCSDYYSNNLGSNIATASSLTMRVYNQAGQLACTLNDTASMKAQVKSSYISIKNCNLPNGEYALLVISPDNIVLGAPTEFDIVDGSVAAGNPVRVLADANVEQNGGPAYQGYPCDNTASPLYVDFREENTYDFLSSPKDGVLFDILGANNSPVYTKSQISWFTQGNMALLALPDQNGEVNNIDQLFGNNTKDANGGFAANGFLALAKYDSNLDRMIDQKDAVFSKLKLWFDKNQDGVAQARELKSLSEKAIVSIDLDYDPNFAERDQYGNEILYKSVVNLRTGSMKAIFDVWFKLSE